MHAYMHVCVVCMGGVRLFFFNISLDVMYTDERISEVVKTHTCLKRDIFLNQTVSGQCDSFTMRICSMRIVLEPAVKFLTFNNAL